MKYSFLTGSIALSLLVACTQSPTGPLPVLGVPHLSPSGDTVEYAIPDFGFTDQDSQAVTQATVAGKIVVADFFFTYCPSICPKMKEQLVRVYEKFQADDRIVILSHTIDPAHDSVATLREYASALGVESRRWHFLTGERDSLHAMAKHYMISAAVEASAPGGYIHSGAFILLDPQRRVRGYYDGTSAEEVDKLMRDIGRLLDEKP
ncbi:MAG: SCO family protein [Bacteroidia bacterium]|nr:SCO family protein [Bacteroidia bacterium]